MRTAACSSLTLGRIPCSSAHLPKAPAGSPGGGATPTPTRRAAPGSSSSDGDGQRPAWPPNARSRPQVPKRRRHSPAGASQLRHQRCVIWRESRYLVPHRGQVHQSLRLCAAGLGNGQVRPVHARIFAPPFQMTGHEGGPGRRLLLPSRARRCRLPHQALRVPAVRPGGQAPPPSRRTGAQSRRPSVPRVTTASELWHLRKYVRFYGLWRRTGPYAPSPDRPGRICSAGWQSGGAARPDFRTHMYRPAPPQTRAPLYFAAPAAVLAPAAQPERLFANAGAPLLPFFKDAPITWQMTPAAVLRQFHLC
jgi:hypothetical protein